MNIKKIFALIIFCLFATTKSHAGILFPWVPFVKLYTGVDYQKPSISNYQMTNENSFSSDLFKLNNANAHIGLRLFDYIGLEFGYNNTKKELYGNEFTQNDPLKVNIRQKYTDIKLYIPLIWSLVSSVDLFVNYGVADLAISASEKEAMRTDAKSSRRYGGGIELSILGTVSARAGYLVLDRKLDDLNSKLKYSYVGLNLYWL